MVTLQFGPVWSVRLFNGVETYRRQRSVTRMYMSM